MKTPQNKFDPFEEAVREKLGENPSYVSSQNSDEVWNKVLQGIEENETSVISLLYTYTRYAAIAFVILSLSALGYYIIVDEENYQHELADKVEVHESDLVESKDVVIEKNVIEEDVTEYYEPAVVQSKTKDESRPTHKTADVSENIFTKNKIKTQTLADGSQVTINHNSKIEYRENDQFRIASLEQGEVYYEVQPNKDKPFKVEFGAYELVVVGTKFNVRNVSNQPLEVTVIEGIVDVYSKANPSKKTRLTKNTQAIVAKDEVIKSSVNSDNYIAWSTNKLKFVNESLISVTAMLERVYQIKIFTPESLKKCTFTGDLSGLEVDDALKMVSLTNGLNLENRNSKYYLSGECD